MNVTFLTNKLS